MLESLEDAEDLVQETFLRVADRKSFEGRFTFRAWLYRIVTNACLDALERRPRTAMSTQANPAEVPWLEPSVSRVASACSDDHEGQSELGPVPSLSAPEEA
jgi:RNA polymerase sigma-70 factor (ECF subfamily)